MVAPLADPYAGMCWNDLHKLATDMQTALVAIDRARIDCPTRKANSRDWRAFSARLQEIATAALSPEAK